MLCDLLTVSSSQLHDLLRRDLDSLTHNQVVEKEFFRRGVSLGTYEGKVTKRFDPKNPDLISPHSNSCVNSIRVCMHNILTGLMTTTIFMLYTRMET